MIQLLVLAIISMVDSKKTLKLSLKIMNWGLKKAGVLDIDAEKTVDIVFKTSSIGIDAVGTKIGFLNNSPDNSIFGKAYNATNDFLGEQLKKITTKIGPSLEKTFQFLAPVLENKYVKPVLNAIGKATEIATDILSSKAFNIALTIAMPIVLAPATFGTSLIPLATYFGALTYQTARRIRTKKREEDLSRSFVHLNDIETGDTIKKGLSDHKNLEALFSPSEAAQKEIRKGDKKHPLLQEPSKPSVLKSASKVIANSLAEIALCAAAFASGNIHGASISLGFLALGSSPDIISRHNDDVDKWNLKNKTKVLAEKLGTGKKHIIAREALEMKAKSIWLNIQLGDSKGQQREEKLKNINEALADPVQKREIDQYIQAIKDKLTDKEVDPYYKAYVKDVEKAPAFYGKEATELRGFGNGWKKAREEGKGFFSCLGSSAYYGMGTFKRAFRMIGENLVGKDKAISLGKAQKLVEKSTEIAGKFPVIIKSETYQSSKIESECTPTRYHTLQTINNTRTQVKNEIDISTRSKKELIQVVHQMSEIFADASTHSSNKLNKKGAEQKRSKHRKEKRNTKKIP